MPFEFDTWQCNYYHECPCINCHAELQIKGTLDGFLSLCIVCEAFHCKCIDPWLTEKRNTCPLCKDVVGRRHGNAAAAAVDETQPLLNTQDESDNAGVTNAGKVYQFCLI